MAGAWLRTSSSRPPATLLRKSRETESATIQKLLPLSRPSDSNGHVVTTTVVRKRKKFTKFRHREKSTPRLRKVIESTSSEEDSGVSLFKSDASDTANSQQLRRHVNQQPHQRRHWTAFGQQQQHRSTGRRVLNLDSVIKELSGQVIEHSICEVTKEERHMGELSQGARLKL